MSSKSSRSSSKYQLYQVLSFVALILAGIIWVLIAINTLFNLSIPGMGTITLIKDICVLGAIALGAYGMVRKMKKGWRIAYWVIVIIAIAAIVFGAGYFTF